MDALRFANDIVDLVGETEHLIIIGAHAFGHHFFIDADHKLKGTDQSFQASPPK